MLSLSTACARGKFSADERTEGDTLKCVQNKAAAHGLEIGRTPLLTTRCYITFRRVPMSKKKKTCITHKNGTFLCVHNEVY